MTGCACSPSGVFNHPAPDICEGTARWVDDVLYIDTADHYDPRHWHYEQETDQ